MRTKDLLDCVGIDRNTYKALQRRDLLPFTAEGVPSEFRLKSEDQSDEYVDRFWSDYLAFDAVALKIMKELYQDLRLKEGDEKRLPLINREVAQYIATGFMWDIKYSLREAADHDHDLWCGWGTHLDHDDSDFIHLHEFVSGSASTVLCKLEDKRKPFRRVICVNCSAIAREVYLWLKVKGLPEAVELAPFFKSAD